MTPAELPSAEKAAKAAVSEGRDAPFNSAFFQKAIYVDSGTVGANAWRLIRIMSLGRAASGCSAFLQKAIYRDSETAVYKRFDRVIVQRDYFSRDYYG